ncbi:MAG: DUF1573 domain-containing protein [bacterium]|nr:DUF1573 domain-containing protein [bacterium]
MNVRYLLLGALLVLGASVLFAQQRGPKALVVDPRFDMGYMPQNAKVAHTFWVNNIGTDSLRIHNIQVSCGCTKTNTPTGAIAVNDSVPIEVVFDIGTRRKAQNKTVHVSSNDPVSSSLELAFTGYIIDDQEQAGPVRITRNEKLNLTNTDFGKTITVEFENRSKTGILPRAVMWPTELLTLEMPKAEIPPNGIGKILVKLKAAPPQKNYTKSFTIEFNDASKSRYTIPVRVAESLSSAKANLQKGS